MADARIQFKILKGFPEGVDKIETQTFLNAAKEIVTVIGEFIDWYCYRNRYLCMCLTRNLWQTLHACHQRHERQHKRKSNDMIRYSLRYVVYKTS